MELLTTEDERRIQLDRLAVLLTGRKMILPMSKASALGCRTWWTAELRGFSLTVLHRTDLLI